MADHGDPPRQTELNRVEAFSDGVIAIVITIMVLELKVPAHADLAGLFALWPVFLAYLLSFLYVAIYWVNHHRLFKHALRATNGLLWSNMALLFGLSLIPFASAYLGEHHFVPLAVTFYMVGLALPAFAFALMQAVIERQSRHRSASLAYLVATRRKGYVSSAIYLCGILLSLWWPALALTGAVIVAIFWILPNTPLNRLFVSRRQGDKVNRG